MKSRTMPIIALGDIEKFYFKIKLHPSQRKHTCFYARFDETTQTFRMGNPSIPWKGVEMLVIVMGISQAPCISKSCILTLAKEVRRYNPATANQFEAMTYFDDISPGVSYNEAKEAYEQKGIKGPQDKLVEQVK